MEAFVFEKLLDFWIRTCDFLPEAFSPTLSLTGRKGSLQDGARHKISGFAWKRSTIRWGERPKPGLFQGKSGRFLPAWKYSNHQLMN